MGQLQDPGRGRPLLDCAHRERRRGRAVRLAQGPVRRVLADRPRAARPDAQRPEVGRRRGVHERNAEDEETRHRSPGVGVPGQSRRLMEQRPKLTLERTFHASPEEVWELWTTKEGIEAWMGPDGFSVAVSELDVRPGGRFTYAMSAVAPEQVQFMATTGMPRVSVSRGRYVEVAPPRLLVYRDLVGFIP